MQGRLYDPALRRFTTADPYVTEPLNPQGLNRYSYVQNNPLNNTDPSGFDCIGSSECGREYALAAMASAAAQAQTQAMAMAAAQASAMGAASEAAAAASAAASAQAGADEQAQHWADMGELANQASVRAMEQAQAQNRTNQDAQRVRDVAFTNPYTPPNPNGLYNGPALGPNWTGYLAENGAGGGSNQQRDAGTNGTSANGQPTPYVDQDPAWLKIAAGMCLLPEVNAAIKLWNLGDKLKSDPAWQEFLADAQKRLDAAKSKYGETDAVMMAKKADIKQVDAIVKEVGLSEAQRRLLHAEIQNLKGPDGLVSYRELLERAQEIKSSFPGK
jgi:hypothetical protein